MERPFFLPSSARESARSSAKTATLLLAALAVSCGSDDSGSTADGGSTAVVAAPSLVTCPLVVSESSCDKTLRPIVFIHGTLGAGDNAEHVAMLFGSNGYCQSRFVAVDYNSVGGDPQTQVDALITQVLAETGQTQVDLMGHSQGGSWGFKYASDPARAPRIANYIHLSGGSQDAPPPGVRTMAITSMSDSTGVSTITGAEKNVVFQTQDHMAVAESTESFVEMYKFLLGKDPVYTDVQCGDELVTLKGKSAAFGDNTPAGGSTIEFYEVGTEPIKRGTPAFSTPVAADGTLTPIQVRRGVAYETRLIDATAKVVGHMYFTPWKRDDYLVRALVPAGGGLAKVVTSMIPADDNFSVLITRWNQGGLRADLGQTLTLNGQNILLPELANASTTTVAYFTWDDNKNGVSDLTALPGFGLVPFVKAADVFIPTLKPAFFDLTFNGATLKVPNWPSATHGPTVVMFQ